MNRDRLCFSAGQVEGDPEEMSEAPPPPVKQKSTSRGKSRKIQMPNTK